MNHIYKVIWNHAKHCYTVVSEIAKSHSQSNKRVRSMTAVVAAAMMLTGFGGMAIEAANPASGDTNITIGKGASFSIWNGVTGHDGFTSGYISIGENAFAWDGEHTYKDKYARIGTKEYLLDFNQGAVSGAESFLGIPYKFRVTDGTKLAGAIAIGKNTMARTGSVMIGDHTYVGKLGDIEVDPSQKMTLNNGVYSTTLGASSYNSGSMATVTGAFSIASGEDTKNFGATIYGSLNSIESSTASNSASGMANSVLGFGNRTQNANASLVWGTGNEVTNSIEKVKLNNPNWNQVSASDAQKQIIEAMQSSDYAGGSVMAIGGGNKADWATYSQLLGVQNTLTGTEQDVSKLTMINGYKNTVANAQNTTIIGSNNKATNIKSTIVMGDNNTLEDRKNVISLGNNNTVTANKAVAIGNGTKVEAEGGVAIGESSVAKGSHSTAIGNESNVDGDDGLAIGYKSQIIKGSSHGTTEATVLGNNSVIGKDAYRSTIIGSGSVIDGQAYCSTIIGAKSSIAWGASGSTAVGQDTKVYKAWGTALGAGSQVTKENGTALGAYSSVTADDGVAIGAISIANRAAGVLGYLADTDTTDTDITWKANKGAVSVGSSAAKMTRQITNVAAGTYDTDAVNVAQLKKALESINIDAGTGIKVDKITNEGKTTYRISTNIVGSETNTDTTTVTPKETDTGNTDTSQGTTNCTSTKIGETVIVGTETKATSFGADDNKTADVKPGETLSINGDKKNISTSVNGKSIQVKLNDEIDVTKVTAETVSVGNTTITTDGLTIKDGPSITKTGIDGGNQTITGVAAGDISDTSTDAINGSQLFETNKQVAQNAQSINKLGNRINKVGAGAAALAALHPLDFDPDDKWDFAAGYGNYNGENAAAIGAYYRPNEDTMFSVGGSFGNGENMVNAGVSLKLGQGNHVSTSKVAMAKEIKDLRKELEGLKSALLDVNAGKKLDTSKLQLFPDVPKNHWAYEYVSTLKGNGVLTGYPDGEFKGDRPMTRYEFATMLYKAMLEGATLSDKILKEFAPELERFTVDTVHQDKDGKPTVERVRTVKAEK